MVLSVVLTQCALGDATSNAPREPRKKPSPPETAPKVVPNTTEAMQTPEFWIDNIKGDPDKVILTPAQINELNRKNQSRGIDFTAYNGEPYSIERTIVNRDELGLQYNVEDPLTLESFPGDSLRARIDRNIDWFRNRKLYDRRNMIYTDEMKDEIIDMMDVDSIPAAVTPRYGIVTRHSNGRQVPCDLKANSGPGGWLDSFQVGMIDYASPVAVLHVSKDRDWYYVRSMISFAWVPAENVALGLRSEINDYVNSDDFLVCTEHKVPIYGDRDFDLFATYYYMGAKVRLLGKENAGYRVSFPYRRQDGMFATATGWVKPDARVHEGYQSFTQRNIIDTVFTLLYRPYGWADSYNERDCCGMVRTVLRTFGLYTGRWTTHQLHASDHIVMFPRKSPVEDKYKELENCEAGICLVGNGGHIAMYLGKVGDSYYVIHQSGYSYEEDGVTYNVNRVNVNDTELPGGSNINNWTEITTLKP